jgi:hypothetical protein
MCIRDRPKAVSRFDPDSKVELTHANNAIG